MKKVTGILLIVSFLIFFIDNITSIIAGSFYFENGTAKYSATLS